MLAETSKRDTAGGSIGVVRVALGHPLREKKPQRMTNSIQLLLQ